MASRTVSRRLLGILAWLGAAPHVLGAQAPGAGAPLRLSSADAVRVASSEAPAVALAGLRTDEADARVRQARSALLPSLSVGGVWANRTFNSQSLGIPFPPGLPIPNPVPPFNDYDGRVSARPTLFDWSSVARVRAAGGHGDRARADRVGSTPGAGASAAA